MVYAYIYTYNLKFDNRSIVATIAILHIGWGVLKYAGN